MRSASAKISFCVWCSAQQKTYLFKVRSSEMIRATNFPMSLTSVRADFTFPVPYIVVLNSAVPGDGSFARSKIGRPIWYLRERDMWINGNRKQRGTTRTTSLRQWMYMEAQSPLSNHDISLSMGSTEVNYKNLELRLKWCTYFVVVVSDSTYGGSCPVAWNETLDTCFLRCLDQGCLQAELLHSKRGDNNVRALDVVSELFDWLRFEVDNANLHSASLQSFDFGLWRRGRSDGSDNMLYIAQHELKSIPED